MPETESSRCFALWANKAEGLLVAIQNAIEATSPKGVDGGVFSEVRWRLSLAKKDVLYQQQRWLEEAAP